MEYEFNWDCDKCWYKSVCNKFGTEECNNQCIRYSEMDYLMYLSNIPKARQAPYSITPEKQDLDNFLYLKDIKDNIKDFVNCGDNLYIYSENSGNGKAQPIDSLVLTETGYVKLKDIKLGSKVYGDDGNLHKVIGIFPQGIQPTYKITFSDDTFTYCTKEHLWTVYPNSKSMRTLTTEDIMNDLNKLTANNKSLYKYRIPLCNPINFKEQFVTIPPYIVGLLIGNLINNDFDINELFLIKVNYSEIYNNLDSLCNLDSSLKYEKRLNNYVDIYYNNKHLKDYLSDYIIVDNKNETNFFLDKKFLQKYTINDIFNRYELLKGIIDISGNFREKSNIIRLNCKYKLSAIYIQTIVQMLGGTCIINEYTNTIRNCNYISDEDDLINSYIVYINLPLDNYTDYCSLSIYKHIVDKLNSKRVMPPKRYITNIQYHKDLECMCIKLDSESELYLTNDCIVTHNTSWAIKMLQEYFNQVWYGNRYRCRGLFIFVPGFLNDIKKNINNPSREFNDLVSRISKADLVVWDDIGANKLSEFDHTQLLSYIDQRNLDLKSNIYTGNLDYNELQEALGNRLLSRVWNNSIRVKLLGEDRRGLDGDPSDS